MNTNGVSNIIAQSALDVKYRIALRNSQFYLKEPCLAPLPPGSMLDAWFEYSPGMTNFGHEAILKLRAVV